MNHTILAQENAVFRGTGGVSAGNGCLGFRPAFRDNETGCVYPSCFWDGRLAPIHLIEGLPDEVVTGRSVTGRVTGVKASVQAGFVLEGDFYGREEAALYSERMLASRSIRGAAIN